MTTNNLEMNDVCKPCEFKHPLGKTVLNSLSAQIAILDAKGRILETNRSWQLFGGRTPEDSTDAFIGVNYIQVCENARGEESQHARAVAAGIRKVIKGDVEEFLHDYPCHTPGRKRWFYMRAIRMDAPGPVRVVVSHEEITELKLTQEALKTSSMEIEKQKQELEEANIALKVLLKQRETDKQDLEQTVLSNIKDMVFPYIEKLKIAPLRPKDKTSLAIIEKHLNDIISPLLQRLANINIILTPQEMQVAALVKDGKSSKEIADILNVAETTVHFHRKNLRKKFEIKDKSTNLRSYLLSMS